MRRVRVSVCAGGLVEGRACVSVWVGGMVEGLMCVCARAMLAMSVRTSKDGWKRGRERVRACVRVRV